MKELFVSGNSLPSAYHNALLALYENGDRVDCTDYNDFCVEASMTIEITEPLKEPMISKLFIGGHFELEHYRREVLDGILDFVIGHGNCWEYTYHDRFAKYIPKVIEDLKRNKDSRRAVISIRDNDVDFSNADPACLQSLHFLIRDDKLHLKVLFRSNDSSRASFMNMFAFIMLQKQVAQELDIPVGSYVHRANSYHIYGTHYETLKKWIEDIKTKPFDELVYEYEGFYKDLMAESTPEIEEKISAQKKIIFG